MTLGSMGQDNPDTGKTNVVIEHDLSVRDVLIEKDELLALERREIFSDNASLEKAFLWRIRMKQCRMFVQVVFDPDDVALRYAEGLSSDDQENSTDGNIVFLKSCQSDYEDKLALSVEHGSKTVLQVFLPINTDHLSSIIDPLVTWSNKSTTGLSDTLHINDKVVTPHANFQLFILVPLGINRQHVFVTYLLRAFVSEQLSNMELSQEGLSSLIHRHIVEESRRELSIQQRALLADLRIHKQSVVDSEVSKFKCTCT